MFLSKFGSTSKPINKTVGTKRKNQAIMSMPIDESQQGKRRWCSNRITEPMKAMQKREDIRECHENAIMACRIDTP
jgi:hypothetical protein